MIKMNTLFNQKNFIRFVVYSKNMNYSKIFISSKYYLKKETKMLFKYTR